MYIPPAAPLAVVIFPKNLLEPSEFVEAQSNHLEVYFNCFHSTSLIHNSEKKFPLSRALRGKATGKCL